MIKNLILLALALVVVVNTTSAQTVEEYKSQIAAKNDQIAALQGEVGALEAKILEFPGWTFGSYGLVGATINGFNNWFNVENPNSSLANISVGLNGFARLNEDKYFWRNDAKLNLGWTKNIEDATLNAELPSDLSLGFTNTADALNITSLFGYKFTPKLAASALAEYRTTVLENFNDPGYLDVGVGVTWLPIKDMIVTLHPLNYRIVFSDTDGIFEPSLGLKYVVDYTRTLNVLNGVSWSSKLSGFYSYQDANQSDWTWINGFGFKAWKGIGIGAEFGLRGSNSEFLSNISKIGAAELKPDGTALFTADDLTQFTFDNVTTRAEQINANRANFGTDVPNVQLPTSSPIQSYWLIGLSYTL